MSITNEQDKARPTGTLGVERWVQFAYAAGAHHGGLVSDQEQHRGLDDLGRQRRRGSRAEQHDDRGWSAAWWPSSRRSSHIALKKIHTFVLEVCVELSKVSWPTRKETWSQTVVVLIVSVIAAIILGVYDAVWSHITDLIYNV